MGHEEAFPPPRLSGRCGIRKRSFAGDCPGHLGFWVRLISLALLFEATARSTPRGFVISMPASGHDSRPHEGATASDGASEDGGSEP